MATNWQQLPGAQLEITRTRCVTCDMYWFGATATSDAEDHIAAYPDHIVVGVADVPVVHVPAGTAMLVSKSGYIRRVDAPA
jgi:hypothetical protein